MIAAGGEWFAGFGQMHTAIFQVVAPEEATHEQKERFEKFSAEIGSIRSPLLGNYVWQVSFRRVPGDLGKLIEACERYQISYRILPLPDEPQWILWNPTEDDPYALKR